MDVIGIFKAKAHIFSKLGGFQIHYSCMISAVWEAIRLFRPLSSRFQKISDDSVIPSPDAFAFSASLPIWVKTTKSTQH